jgi:hypothetical protein
VWRTGIALAALTSSAHADRLVLDEHHVAAALTLEVSLDDGARTPTSIAPDVWFGITRRWTAGIVHGNQSLDRIASGASICAHCDDPYHNSGIDVRWAVREGAFAVAPRVRLLVRDIGPVKPALTLGALARLARGALQITSDPYLQLGLMNRDRGNRAVAVVPIWLGVRPTGRSLVALHTGIDGELATWRDGWHVPIAIVAQTHVWRGLEVGLEAGFPSLLGPQNDYKRRALLLGVMYRGGPVAIGR